MKRALAACLLVAAPAAADPLRLRADALASAQSPAGLLVLEADAEERPELGAEAVVWLAGAREHRSGDVLVIVVRGRTTDGRANGRIGRFVSTLGALRPAHVDGGAVRLRLPHMVDVEAVVGVPVMPGLATGRAWDWLAGGRVSRRLGDYGSVGVAYAQRRDAGRLESEELGIDTGFALDRKNDLGARLAYDLANPGIAEVAVTARHVHKPVRTDLYFTYRAASHLLPATSLFSVIGDAPAQRFGTVITWPAAPRLDLVADLGVRLVVRDAGAELVARARLKLDDKGTSALTGELRRSGVADQMWTGARGAARIALPHRMTFASELELVMPDHANGRGRLWPWALVALDRSVGNWQTAFALEASASPQYRHRVDVLFQLATRWGKP